MLPLLCIFGLAGDLLCVVVLTRRHMRKPFNSLLATLAVTDAFALVNLLLQYVFYSTRLASSIQCDAVIKYLPMLFKGFGRVFGRHINCWLTVSIASVRLYFISRKTNNRQLTYKHVALIVSCVVIVATPSYIPIYFIPKYFEKQGRRCVHEYEVGVLSREVSEYLHFANVIIPSVLMMILSVLILVVVCKGAKQRQRLTTEQISRQTNRTTVRTTVMILVMVVMSFLNILPLVIYYMEMYIRINMPLWFTEFSFNFMEIFLVINCSADVFLFSISSEFCKTLKSLFTCKCCKVSTATIDESQTVETSG